MRKRIKIKKIYFPKNVLIKYLITPLLFAGVIYTLGFFIIFLFSPHIPFLKGKEYIFIFIFFIISLKSWGRKRWKQKNIWRSLGFLDFGDNILSPNSRKELAKSFLIIFSWSFLLIVGGYIRLTSFSNYNFLFDILFTAVFVGIAEELLFRVWLFEEFSLYLNKTNAIILQALVFSLVHAYNFEESLLTNILIKIGLFLLGIYLNLLRVNHYQNIFPSIYFHGGIVGFIFLAKSLFEIQKDYPYLIFGTQYDKFINPVSGLIGICTLLSLNFYQIQILNSRKIID